MACLPEHNEVTFINGGATYVIEYDGMTCNNSTSTWCATVTVTGDPALSHWVWGTCTEPLPTVISATRNGEPLEIGPDKEVELGTDPTTGVTGIKFNSVGVSEQEGPVQFCVTLAGCFVEEPQDVGAKGGGGSQGQKQENAFCGPSCTALPPVQRCAVCGDCAEFNLNDIPGVGQTIRCVNSITLGGQLDLTNEGLGSFFVAQTLPFELFIIRKTQAT